MSGDGIIPRHTAGPPFASSCQRRKQLTRGCNSGSPSTANRGDNSGHSSITSLKEAGSQLGEGRTNIPGSLWACRKLAWFSWWEFPQGLIGSPRRDVSQREQGGRNQLKSYPDRQDHLEGQRLGNTRKREGQTYPLLSSYDNRPEEAMNPIPALSEQVI